MSTFDVRLEKWHGWGSALAVVSISGGSPPFQWLLEEETRPAAFEAWEHTGRVLCDAVRCGALAEVQWLLSVVPPGSQLEALKCLALAQAAVSSRGAICKWLLDNGTDGNIYVVKDFDETGCRIRTSSKEALVAHVYRRSGVDFDRAGHKRGAPWPAPLGTSPPLLDIMTILLPMASSDMAAMRGLAEVVSEQADAASLQMVVAKLPDGSATTFNDGQTMLHVLVKAANEYIERLISTPKSKTYLRLICGTPASYHQQRFLCDLSMARGGRGCTTCDAEFARRKELFKVCLAVLIDLRVPLAVMDDQHSSALALCSKNFVEGQVLLRSALEAQSGDADRPKLPVDVRECAVCMQQEADIVLMPCGHLCVCHRCAPRLQGLCPICRANTSQVVRVYHN